MSESTTSSFDFNAFISESKETLLNPKSYFSKMKLTGGMTEPLIKAVIYGAVAGVIVFLWSILGLGAAGAGFLGGAIGAMALVWYIVAAIIGLFVGAVILLIISSICKGNSDFEANLRVTAATMVVMPVSALLGFTMGINIYLGMIVSLAVSIYAIWMLYHGLVEALKAKPESAKIVMYVLIGLIVLFTLAGLSTRNRVNKLMKGYDTEELRDVMKDLEENKN